MYYDLKFKFQDIKLLSIWNSNKNINNFSINTSSYMNEIGDYLFTLVQNLQPYIEIKEQEANDENNNDLFKNIYDVSYWLDLIITALVKDILDMICNISTLSDLGSKQLSCDLKYLLNIFSALSIDINEQLLLINNIIQLCDINYKQLNDFDTSYYVKLFSDISHINNADKVLKSILNSRNITIKI